MQFRKDINILDFLRTVGECREDVTFCTKEGDVLNLQSALSRYVFATIANNSELLRNAEIVCKNTDDAVRLKLFVEEE